MHHQPTDIIPADRIRRAIWAATSIIAAANLMPAPSAEAAADHPNILLVLVDDLGCMDLAIDGSSFHITPRIDALARGGVRFANFYAAHPVCSPTRAALMTGKAPQRIGISDYVRPNSSVALPPAELSLGEAFAGHGYQTAYFGKWHLGNRADDGPEHHGFSSVRAVNRAGQPASYYFPFRRSDRSSHPADVPDLENAGSGAYLTDALTSEVIAFLRERDVRRPFFVCLGHYAVHTPLQPPTDLLDRHRERRLRQYGSSATPERTERHGARSRTRQDDPAYAAMVESLDFNVGRLVDTLKELGLTESTIFLLTSDNGGLSTLTASSGRVGPTSNLPWRAGKGWTYEGGIRIPLYISWPGQLTPGQTAVLAWTADLYPTLLEFAGLPLLPAQHKDGRSLAAILRRQSDETSLGRRSLAWYYPHEHGSGHRPSAALRLDRFKIILSLESGSTELYDLEADASEANDLSSIHPDTVRFLRRRLLAWIEETGGAIPPELRPLSSE